MADAHTANLCSEIIHTHFGPLPATIASILLTRGRLGLSQLVRFSSLKAQTVRAIVLVLLQQNVLWYTTDDGGEVLEFNIDECLMRLRFGRFVWQAEEIFGQEGADIVQLILDHGKLRPPEIITRLANGNPNACSKYAQIIHGLVSSAYIKPSTIFSHVSPRDKRIKYEEEEKAKITGFPTAKQLREAKEIAEARVKREEEEGEKIGMKRKAKDSIKSRPAKRKATVEDENVVDDTVYFRVNFEKFSIHIRNKLIEKAAKDRFNEGAALVLRAALKCTQTAQKNLSDIRSESISVANIVLQLSDVENLSSGLAYNSKKVSNTTCIKDYLGMLSSADNPTQFGRASSFVSFTASKVQVEFEVIARRMKRRVLEAITRERHGSEGVRIIRLLMDTGKMDEKQISKIVMMASKDVRPLLSALAGDSLISTQEVPRSADRNPTRTFYLWYVDIHKVYSVILGNLYKTLHNISVRRRTEREETLVKAVLEKRERSDVILDEGLLSALDREIITEWEKKESKLTVLEMRVEENVFVLKDLAFLGIDDEY